MGYTHYFTFHAPKRGETAKVEKAYQKAIKECNKVILAWQADALDHERLSGFSAHCKPGQYGGLQVNGKQDEGHEDFILREHFKQNTGGFCKTARKPYDTVVAACLLILKKNLVNNFSFDSDGFADEFAYGQALAEKVLKKKYPIPAILKTRPLFLRKAG